MKKLLITIFLLLGNVIYSQNLIQTYVDRCTGIVNVFTVPMNGSTTVAFYNRSRTFTSTDFQNGNLQSWLEETYLWWTSLNPCSTNQTQQTTVQTTVQQTATQAATAATQAVATPPPTPTVNVSPPPTSSPTPAVSTPEVSTPVVDTPSTDTSVPTVDTGSSNTTNESPIQTGEGSQPTETSTGETQPTETTAEASSTETSEPQTETQETESTPSDSGDGDTQSSETEDSSTSQNENESDSESTSEDTQEETSTESDENQETEESVEESSEESSEEETTEETTEEESKEEESSEEESESDESEEESSEETSEDKEEEKKDEKKKKKKTFAPPIISANLSSMQNIDGTFNQTMTIGASRSSLLGTETYSLNGMVWDNLKQFMLNASYSKVHINKEGRVDRVFSASIGGARMFTTTMGNNSLSWTFLGKKGAVKGIALTNSLISLEFNVVQGQIEQDAVLWSPAVTGFYTKSFNFDRFNVSPMLAVSSPFLTYDLFDKTEIWNKDIMLITGANLDYQLTKQFKVNLGVNTINNTNPDIKMTWNFTIGSRFSL